MLKRLMRAENSPMEIITIPDFVTMLSISYHENGKVKNIVYRSPGDIERVSKSEAGKLSLSWEKERLGE